MAVLLSSCCVSAPHSSLLSHSFSLLPLSSSEALQQPVQLPSLFMRNKLWGQLAEVDGGSVTHLEEVGEPGHRRISVLDGEEDVLGGHNGSLWHGLDAQRQPTPMVLKII